MLGVIVIYVVLFGGLWWFMMRPQKKEQKRIQAMLASMEVGTGTENEFSRSAGSRGPE